MVEETKKSKKKKKKKKKPWFIIQFLLHKKLVRSVIKFKKPTPPVFSFQPLGHFIWTLARLILLVKRRKQESQAGFSRQKKDVGFVNVCKTWIL